eukprot:jgi/Psemu1/5391/gm1.5391_g
MSQPNIISNRVGNSNSNGNGNGSGNVNVNVNAANSVDDKKQDVAHFVSEILSQMENDFHKAGDSIMDRMREMGSKMDDLEESISGLMLDAGLEDGEDDSIRDEAGEDNDNDNDYYNYNYNDHNHIHNRAAAESTAASASASPERRPPTNASPSRTTEPTTNHAV